jgi:REP element-mobilizing transposase RayT
MGESWRYRQDEPGGTQFITVKGVGGLPIFALREDARYFLSLVAREVRAGELEVLSFAFVRNHAHFLVVSPHGRIDRPMKRILETFARYYNRTRDRTGHVFKDRFHSSAVGSEAYFLCCVAYTDMNPVDAGLTDLPTRYELGSAAMYLRRRAPLWLSRLRVAAYVPGADPLTGAVSEERYLEVFAKFDRETVREMIERRLYSEKDADDPLDLFFAPDRARRIAWIREQARRADGTSGARLLAKASVLEEVIEEMSGRRDWTGCQPRESPVRWRTLLVGLLRLGGARSCREVEIMLGISAATVTRETRRYRELLTEDSEHLEAAEKALSEAVRRTFRFLPPFPAVGPDGRPAAREGK